MGSIIPLDSTSLDPPAGTSGQSAKWDEAEMDVRDGFTDTIGRTPLIRLRRASEETGCAAQMRWPSCATLGRPSTGRPMRAWNARIAGARPASGSIPAVRQPI